MRTSLIIASHNEGASLANTIVSCVETCGDLDYEIIVADDASTDGSTEDVERRFPQIRIYRHPHRMGASPTKALGGRHARGGVFVFLDGHCKPEFGAIARLVHDVEETSGLAIVTPAVVALDVPNWKNDFSQIGNGYSLELRSFECGWISLSAMRPISEGHAQFYESPGLNGCALAVSRELYDKLWGFDSHMRYWGVEDLDFGLKCWLMGYRILHDPAAIVGHRFRENFDNYTVPIEHVVTNQLRMAGKNLTYGVWAEWLESCQRRYMGSLAEHAEGLWAHVWQLFNKERSSAEQERSYLMARRPRDEFWFAERFGLSWPILLPTSTVMEAPLLFGASPKPSHGPSPSPKPTPTPKPSPSPKPSPAPPGLLIVNMIPKSLSDETNQDSEPNISVNQANILKIAATAFTPDPSGGGAAPIYVSTDGGRTWRLNATVPGGNPKTGTSDITLRFGGKSNVLYVSDLRGDNQDLNELRTTDFTSSTPMTVLKDRGNDDQPFIQAETVVSGPDSGKDRVYIGNNDFGAQGGLTATVDVCLDATAVAPAFTSVRIEKRATLGQDGPQIRTAIHSGGVIYSSFYGWRSSTGSTANADLVVTGDVVVVRDDSWASGAKPFTALVDPGDGMAGIRVAQGVTFPFQLNGLPVFGQNRRGGDLSIAVDPNDSDRVYLAYADTLPAGYTVHLRTSSNKGAVWSPDLLTLVDATVPAVAVSSTGEIGFLYQQLAGAGANQRWLTHLRFSSDQGAHWSDLVLCTVPSSTPGIGFDPYLGDYIYLTAVGKDFYGIFCANNTPDVANFPNGVTYQRNANFTNKTLLGNDNTTPVRVSIDPFFVKATRQ